MAERADLEEYARKRDFGTTPEPKSRGGRRRRAEPRFVVQRHAARSLHFDLRLERDGALASWAVPKGVPLHRGIKRLAVRTEDHPLEYLDFAAVIPEGQYGAGRMTIWDAGTYEAERWDERELKLTLHGDRLAGPYHMVKTGGAEGKEEWLIFRSGSDGEASPDPHERFASLRPMMATLVDAPFDDDGWAFELKWDGYRALALVTSDGTELRSRTGRDLRGNFPDLDLRRAVLAQEAVLDGEVVVLDKDGRASFQALQAGRGPVTFVAFDLLYEDGAWLLDRPWRERTARLDAVLSPDAPPRAIRSDHVVGRGRALYEAAEAAGVEGIVAKRVDAAYHPARRGDDWRKVKVRQRLTAVIGGYSAGAGARRGSFGALLVGAYDADGLHYLGHVGSGFGDDDLRSLRARLDALADPTCPFVAPPPEARGVRWVRPELTCTVLYAEWTDDRRLRAPVFAGLSDVPPAEARLSAPPSSPTPLVDPGLKEQRIAEGGREIRLTNLPKPFWPEEGITKGDLLRYYAGISTALLPHLAGRPMVLKRYPNGWDKPFFFQHNLPADAPEWLSRIELMRGDKPSREPNRYGIVDDPLSLLWVVNLGCIDLNPWQSPADAPDEPTHVLFDLDPAEGLPFDAVVEVALLVREELDALGLRGVPKTSGSDGMHVFLPVGPGHNYEVTKLFAQAVAERLVRRRPDLVTTEGLIAKRGARVYLDANQNGRGKTVASVYSVRPRPGAPVSTPLAWSEVRPGLDPRTLGMSAALERVAKDGDLFADVLYEPQDLAPAVARLAGGT